MGNTANPQAYKLNPVAACNLLAPRSLSILPSPMAYELALSEVQKVNVQAMVVMTYFLKAGK